MNQQNENIDISIDIEAISKTLSLRQLVLGGLISIGIGCTFTPLLFKNLNRESKTLFLFSGLAANLTACFLPINSRENKLKQTWENAVTTNYATQLQHEIARVNTQTEIEEENNLAKYVEKNVPTWQLSYWAEKLGIAPLISKFFIEQSEEVEEESTSNQWVNNPFSHKALDNQENEASSVWIEQLIEESVASYDRRNHQHLIINAPTQSGKSTLAACLIGLFCKRLDGKVQTIVIDPKHSDTNWLVPVNYGGYENARAGLTAAIKELDKRKKLAKQAQDKGLDKPNFDRLLVIMDEWTVCYGGGKGYAKIISKETAEDMLADVQRLLAESAFVDITLFLIGQSPLSGDNGLSRPMMENATRITINKTAIRWLNDKDFPNVELKTPFKRQINQWLAEKKRCVMVLPMVGEAYCELIPVINLKAFKANEDPLNAISKWYYNIFKDFGHYPNDMTLKEAWRRITSQELTDGGIQILREKIENKGE